MGKRNIRIRHHELAARLGELPGREAQIVLLDGRTFFGTVLSATPDAIVVRDANARWTSRRRHTHTLKLVDVQEAILDVVTSW